MSEADTRLFLSILGVSTIIGYILAIVFALQGLQFIALLFLLASLVDIVATFFVYRSYTTLRGARWQNELKATEEKMQQALTENTDKIGHQT